MTIFEKSGLSKFDQMRKSIAKKMFKAFPQAPLTTLIWMKSKNKVPSDIEFDIILKETCQKTMTGDHLESPYNEEAPKGEIISSNDKKQKLDSKNANSAAKRFKSTNHAGM